MNFSLKEWTSLVHYPMDARQTDFNVIEYRCKYCHEPINPSWVFYDEVACKNRECRAISILAGYVERSEEPND